jgi:hypothetical protein
MRTDMCQSNKGMDSPGCMSYLSQTQPDERVICRSDNQAEDETGRASIDYARVTHVSIA